MLKTCGKIFFSLLPSVSAVTVFCKFFFKQIFVEKINQIFFKTLAGEFLI